MTVSSKDIEAAYHAAMDSLSPPQREALALLKRAHQFERMNNQTLTESLHLVFDEQARRCNEEAAPNDAAA